MAESETDKTKSPPLFGRSTIYTLVDEITRDNLPGVISAAVTEHANNATEISYLTAYEKGCQPILKRTKKVRPEICNKTVENHAAEATAFFSGYFMGESCKYIQRGAKKGISDDIDRLNEYMYLADKESHDEELVNQFYCTGIGYRMCLANSEKLSDVPFEIDTPDPACTFIVYKSGFGKRRMIGCQIIKMPDETVRYAGYTKTHYFETDGQVVLKWEPHTYGDIPIFEYNAYTTRMGVFEPVIDIFDAINRTQSNRLDGIEAFIQALLVFVNCDIDPDDVNKLRESGFVKLKTMGDVKAEIQLIAEQLDQMQTQALIDCMRDTAKEIMGMPNNTKGLGGGASGNVGSVVAWQGWELCEPRIKKTERLYKRSDRLFMRHVLKIINDTDGISLTESDIEPEFARHNIENILVKTQSLQTMLGCGIEPAEAIAAVKIWSDPNAVTTKSKPYLKKWEYKEPEVTPNGNNGSGSSNPNDAA